MRSKYRYIVAICPIIFAICLIYAICNTETFQRIQHSFQSEFGGLNRTLTVYDYNGNAIKSYSGRFDVGKSENEVYFDLNGKRVIIHGGIVINEEQ